MLTIDKKIKGDKRGSTTKEKRTRQGNSLQRPSNKDVLIAAPEHGRAACTILTVGNIGIIAKLSQNVNFYLGW